MQHQKLSYQDFDPQFEAALQKFYKKPMVNSKTLLSLYKTQKPNASFFKKLQQDFKMNEARLLKMIAGWAHKTSEPWSKEMLDRVCALIKELFTKFYNTRITKKQICDLITDEIIDQLKLNDEKYQEYDMNYMNRLIYGKTMEICKTYEPQSDDETETEEEK
ncbi:Hypothetical_protein [Hexamita inflata]|uniref:Hypothetical_protein n=1 Tax=Hexamita inflata TaxID=28002 RepID=A0AA86PB98_9EUKA|nr:Hypothetical protein HINF_LOCUS21160 [Hexamita inflata]